MGRLGRGCVGRGQGGGPVGHGMWCRGDVGQAVEHDDQVRGQLDTDEEDRDADRLLEAAQEHLASRASSNRVISMV